MTLIQIIESIKPLMGPFLFLLIRINMTKPKKPMNQEEDRF